MSFDLCEQIWRVLDGRVCHLLLMMSYVALWQFVTKRGSTYVEGILLLGGVFVVLELWSFRLYLGASFRIYIFGS